MIDVIELRVEPDSATPRAVRRLFAEHFASCPFVDDLLLCVSEVLSNAVIHAATPISVVAGFERDAVRVEISDSSVVAPTRLNSDPLAATGRGLLLLDALTSAWGVDVRADGKTVWFEIGTKPV